MERIGSSSPPVPSAGVDPAYIPGLTPPPAAEAQSPAALEKADIPPEEVETEAEPEVAAEAAPETVDAEATESADDAEVDEEEDDDPLFEATDRRGAIIADRHGITFRLDDQQAEFGWDEIGAVEIDTPRFGRRFSVTVYISARRWFQSDVEAPTRTILKEWTYDLDKVLDAHFEEGTSGDEEDDEDQEILDADADADTEDETEDATASETDTDADPAPSDTEDNADADADESAKPAAKSEA
ncbi:MAG: hypothetical protein QOF98_2289 [Streptomyces sp.]|nr:hypothetical protein [Streptomyces sp.]